jgi:Type IV secretion system pilin
VKHKLTLFLSALFAASLLLLLTPIKVLASCNGPNGKTGVCYGQVTCSGTSSTLCCDLASECPTVGGNNNPKNINCTANSIAQCLASQPVGCSKDGPYCCATENDCSLLGGVVDTSRSHAFANTGDITKCSNGSDGIQTAIGCIPVFDQTNFLAFILRWAVGIGGGIAFLLMVYSGFMIMTAAGNPERLKAGQELLTSAISGLILLVFSIFVLKFIGVDILQLCKFGFGPKC